MPFIETTSEPDVVMAETAVPPTPRAPGVAETLAAAFRQDNTVVNLFRGLMREQFPEDPAHNPLELILGTPYESNHLDKFVASRSEAETRAIMRRIDEEEADRKTLDAAGFPGFVAQAAAGLISPEVLLPGGAIARSAKGGYSVLRAMAAIGAAAGGQTAAQEGILQAMQETRTAGESAFAVGSATLLGALIGAGAANLLSVAERKTLERALDADRADIDLHLPAAPQAAGAAATDTRRLELVRTGLEATARLSPTRRLMSVESVEARRIAADLAETPYRFKENLEGIATTQGPALDRLARMQVTGARVAVADTLDELYSSYRFGVPDAKLPNVRAQIERFMGSDEGKMTPAEFRREVSNALRNGDRHEIPQVAQAAQFIRARVFEPWKRRAIEAGLLGEDTEVRTAESYFTRVWNKEAIRAKRPEFVNKVTDWLKSDQATKAAAKERLAFFSAQLRSWNQQIRKLEDRFARIDDKIERLEARAAERGGEAKATESRAETVEERQGRIADEAADLNDAINLLEELAEKHPTVAPILKRTEAMFQTRSRQHDVVGAVADEARRGERRNIKRLDVLKERLSNAAERKALIEEYLSAAEQVRQEVRAKIEAEIGAWEGKSATEAKAALKAREKYAKDTARADNADPLRSADAAVDRAVKRIIESDRDLSDAELRSRAQEITDRIVSSPDGRLPYDISRGGPRIGFHEGPPPRGPLAAREFAIPDNLVREFLEDDAEQVVNLYLRSVVPDVLLTERFGDVEMTPAFRRINEDYAARIDAAKSEKDRIRLGKERDAVIRDMAAIRDRIRGVYGWSPDLANMARVANAAKNANNLTSMGVAAIASLIDLSGVVFRYGLGATLRDGWMPFFRGLLGSEGYNKAKSQWRAVGIGVETAINARQHAIDDVMDVYRPQTRTERALQYASDKFFIANLLAPFTDVAKTIAANVAASEILRAARAVAAGKASKRQIANLADAGIDAQMAQRIAAQFERGGEVIDGVHLPNTADWTDRAAAQALEGAVARETDIAVITPGQEKPLWLSKPVVSMLGQFKSFTASATERILIANLQRRDAQVLQGLAVMMALGMLSYKLNSVFGGQPTSDRPQDWFKEGISRSGLLGWFEEANAVAAKTTRGAVDVYRLIGADKPASRFVSRGVVDMFLGPTAGKMRDIAQVAGSASTADWQESDTKALRRLIAMQNLFYVRGLFNRIEESANARLGIQ